MAYDEKLAERVREVIAASEKKVEEKKMFGSLCFMVNNKMCVCVQLKNLMLRIAPEKFEQSLAKKGCGPMQFGKRTMKGFIYVDEAVLKTKKQLEAWLALALEYNKIVQLPKKKNISS